MVYPLAHGQLVTHLSTNRARRRVTSLIETNALPLSHTTKILVLYTDSLVSNINIPKQWNYQHTVLCMCSLNRDDVLNVQCCKNLVSLARSMCQMPVRLTVIAKIPTRHYLRMKLHSKRAPLFNSMDRIYQLLENCFNNLVRNKNN